MQQMINMPLPAAPKHECEEFVEFEEASGLGEESMNQELKNFEKFAERIEIKVRKSDKSSSLMSSCNNSQVSLDFG